MKVLRINPVKPEREFILEAADYVNRGRIIIYPTDTVYGIGCRIDALHSVEQLFEIKKRSLSNPLSIACSSMEMVGRCAVLDEGDELFIEERLDGAFTFIAKKRDYVDDLITAGRDSVGVRLPSADVVRELIEGIDCPVITTSANTSGRKAPSRVEEIEQRMLDSVDLLIDSGPCRVGKPSKIIDLRTRRVLRD